MNRPKDILVMALRCGVPVSITACVLFLAGQPLAVASPPVQTPRPLPADGMTVQVRVVDAYSGLPVEQAPVQLVGYPYLKVTDADGWARFDGLPIGIGSLVTVWTTPGGHGPASREWTITTPDSWIPVRVPPIDSTLSTSLIDPELGGRFNLKGFLPADPPVPVNMEIEVPPNAFDVPVRVHLLPYPQHAFFLHGAAARGYMLGLLHVAVTDANGRSHSQSLGAPITVRSTPYAMQGIDFTAVFDLTSLAFQTYDYTLHEWIEESTTPSYDAQSGMIEYTTLRLSLTACTVELPPGAGGTPPPPPPSVYYKSSRCEQGASATVYCGTYTNGASSSMSAATPLYFCFELSAQLEAIYGVQAGSAALGTISSQIGTKLSGTVGGAVKGTTGASSSVTIVHGASAGSSCFSGVDRLYRVTRLYGVQVGGVELGVITVPSLCVLDQERIYVQSCCPGSGSGEERGSLLPPNPGPLKKKPSDCIER